MKNFKSKRNLKLNLEKQLEMFHINYMVMLTSVSENCFQLMLESRRWEEMMDQEGAKPEDTE